MSLSLQRVKQFILTFVGLCAGVSPFHFAVSCRQLNSPISVALSICSCANLMNKRQRDSVGYVYTSRKPICVCLLIILRPARIIESRRRWRMWGAGGVVFPSTWAFCDTLRILSRRELPRHLPKHELMNFLETQYDMYHATFMWKQMLTKTCVGLANTTFCTV
jgi:hypothetical protein